MWEGSDGDRWRSTSAWRRRGMDRDVKVESMSGGPNAHAVYLLDSMEARA